MTQLQPGDQAPDFTLPASNGGTLSLSGLRGRNVVLYFYPKDDTPGCTQEACDFRDRSQGFADLNTVIVGISTDPLTAHETFIGKFGLPFTLVSDADHQVHEQYGTWRERTFNGQTRLGTERSTFVIDGTGVIRRIDRKVKVEGHVEDVLNFVRVELAPPA